MAWKILSDLKHDGVLHKIGDIVQHFEGLAVEEIRKLEHEGVVQNLEADAKADEETVAGQLKQDAGTVETQAKADEEMARGQVDSQVQAAVNQDIADSERLAQTPGQDVTPGGHQPTADEIAATAASQN